LDVRPVDLAVGAPQLGVAVLVLESGKVDGALGERILVPLVVFVRGEAFPPDDLTSVGFESLVPEAVALPVG